MSDAVDEARALVTAYRQTFGGESARIVLGDLALYCFEDMTTFVPESQRASDIQEGRRQVILHIREKLGIDPTSIRLVTQEGDDE